MVAAAMTVHHTTASPTPRCAGSRCPWWSAGCTEATASAHHATTATASSHQPGSRRAQAPRRLAGVDADAAGADVAALLRLALQSRRHDGHLDLARVERLLVVQAGDDVGDVEHVGQPGPAVLVARLAGLADAEAGDASHPPVVEIDVVGRRGRALAAHVLDAQIPPRGRLARRGGQQA